MSDPKFQRPTGAAPQRQAPANPASSPAGPPAGDPNAPGSATSGRVVHDERGNAIWQWVTTTTKNAILSGTSLLKKLDSSGLSLEETPPEDDKAAMLPKQRPGGGFNPYEQANKPRGKK
jgi:hypothetical protein